MTQEEGNKLIAEFMGGKLQNIGNGDYYDGAYLDTIPAWEEGGSIVMWKGQRDCVSPNDLSYHLSFDWLMPVVEKIEADRKYRVPMVWNCCDVNDATDGYSNIVEITGMPTKIEAVWQAVVQFIEWYNKQSKPQS